MSASRTIIGDEERLDNVHPGDILREDFLIGSDIPLAEVAEGSGLSPDLLESLMARRSNIDAETDLRLARYFGMSDGFFLRLQNHWDIEEVLRARSGELNSIVQRAA